MNKNIVLAVVIALLALGLVGSVYAGYAGYGMIQTGGPSARVGSIGGPLINTGGINSGK